MWRSNLILLWAGLALHSFCSPFAMATSEEQRNGRRFAELENHPISLSSRGGLRSIQGGTAQSSKTFTREFSEGILFFDRSSFSGIVSDGSGQNAAGKIAATIVLSLDNTSCVMFASACNSLSAGLSLSGTNQLAAVSGGANAIDTLDVGQGSTSTGIPEPSTFYMFGTGLIGITLATVRKLRGI